ncbi:SPFH domain-containing protein [Alkaliphilus oremlandii]|uniref:Band 7 protein n=1 Tax=Alkaliphilus oremlandii (strain OhILAs) TaxID=350688 RepID=A8MLV9_ALKOO|nr:SPFH domain-containing protein [Alkaliphilus oremlandii]ABW18126.1 band 7 protein [Alkaliphilus oremlandii OhILAs]
MVEKIMKDEHLVTEERKAKSSNGMVILILNIVLMVASIFSIIIGANLISNTGNLFGILFIVIGVIYLMIVGPILFAGLKVLKPNEALVLTLFGKYTGTLKGEGFFFVNPFSSAVSPASKNTSTGSLGTQDHIKVSANEINIPSQRSKKISLKAMTLNNDKQKINDQMGNPIIIGVVVIWKVVNTAKAVFNVDNYAEYLSIQTDSALRDITRLYPYDSVNDDNEKSLRGSSLEVAEKLRHEIQKRVNIAGLEVVEARITHLAYAPEIASTMLQRQQASAIIDARQMIVEGAVGMVEMALAKLSENDIVTLDEERKAAMVSNLLVVLCGNKEAQPIVNSGSLY